MYKFRGVCHQLTFQILKGFIDILIGDSVRTLVIMRTLRTYLQIVVGCFEVWWMVAKLPSLMLGWKEGIVLRVLFEGLFVLSSGFLGSQKRWQGGGLRNSNSGEPFSFVLQDNCG